MCICVCICICEGATCEMAGEQHVSDDADRVDVALVGVAILENLRAAKLTKMHMHTIAIATATHTHT